MMRYYNRQTKTEVIEKDYDSGSADHVALDDGNPFFHAIPEGKQLTYDSNGIPNGLENIAAPTLNESKAQKILDVNHIADIALLDITNPYPESERLSWDKQEQEARAWFADNSAATPLIDAMISGRGTDKADQVNRIIQKADAFAAQSGLIFGKRQAYVDQLDAATTVAEVEAITVDYSE